LAATAIKTSHTKTSPPVSVKSGQLGALLVPIFHIPNQVIFGTVGSAAN